MPSLPNDEDEYFLSQIRQRPSRLQAKKIGNVVRRLMSQSGYGQTQFNARLETAWSDAVGKELSPLTQVGRISRGVLHVNVANSTALQEISFNRRGILAQLNQQLPELKLKGLRAQVGPVR